MNKHASALLLRAAFALLLAAALPAHALSEEDRGGFLMLVLGPKENPVKTCSISAIRLNLFFTYRVFAKSTDEATRDMILGTATTPEQRAKAERDYATWVQYHRPGPVAENDFHECLDKHQLNLRQNLGREGTSCFNLLAVPDTALALKEVIKMPRAEATEKMRQDFKTLSPAFVDKITEQIYVTNGAEDDYLGHRRVLAQCIRDVR